jgi:hypothetical protein
MKNANTKSMTTHVKRKLVLVTCLVRTILAVLAADLVSSTLFTQDAQAALPITGDIGFIGAAHFNTTSLATATEVETWRNCDGVGGFLTVSNTTGTYAGIPLGSNALMAAPWIFNPSVPTPALWSVAGFTFNLNSDVIVVQTTTFLNVTGTGIVSGNGFAPTPAHWAFTTQSAGGRTETIFTLSADTHR